MSRVGKKLIPMPKGVKIKIGDQLTVEGPKGKQTVPVPKGITFSEKDGVLTVLRDGDDKAALHGLTRALTANAIQGVSTGFTREKSAKKRSCQPGRDWCPQPTASGVVKKTGSG